MHITIIGTGYVGLVAAACLAELGHEVICVDNDREKLELLHSGGMPVHEAYLPQLLERHRGRRLSFSTRLADAVARSQAVFVAVGTPMNGNGDADLSNVEAVAREIAGSLEDDYKVVVCKSTVPVYTSAWVERVMLLNGAPRESFDVVVNPEFLREGTAVTDFLYPDRIVVGGESERAAAVMEEIYEPLVSGRYASCPGAVPRPEEACVPAALLLTGSKSAELIKHASNAFLAMKVSFINAVANLCEAVEADVVEVCRGVGSDRRIGERFLRPGLGYGGSCFPKDLAAFRRIASECGYELPLVAEVDRINAEQRSRFLQKVRNALWTLKSKRLAVLGLAFKGGTDDIRESPALHIVEALLKEGCQVVAYDPAAMPRARRQLEHKSLGFAADAYAAAAGADALLILTDWEEFARLDLECLRQQLRYPIVIDGRNLFDPQVMASAGLSYISVGRREYSPTAVPGFRQRLSLRKAVAP